MTSVAISPKFQIVIPREIRKKLQLFTGQKVQVIVFGNRIKLIHEKKIKIMRGFL